MAKRLSKEKERYLAAHRDLNPRTTQVESSHKSSSRDTLPKQWKILDVFHVDLLTPYRETEFHGVNYNQPPPDLVGEEEQYKVEQVLDECIYGRWKKKQYLVKWKGYSDSDK